MKNTDSRDKTNGILVIKPYAPLTKSGTSDKDDGRSLSFTSLENLRFKYMLGDDNLGMLDDSTGKKKD